MAQVPATDAAAVAVQDARSVAEARRWQVQELGLGVTLRRAWFGDLLGRPQSLCVLEVDRRQAGVHLDLAVPERLTGTSVQAARAGALAAVNGGFFLPDGKPRGLRRLRGRQVTVPSVEPHAAVGWSVALVRFGSSEEDWKAWPEVLEAGPRLVTAGQVVLHGRAQQKVRHPRTALGERADGVLLFVTADGRTPPAAGLTLDELGAVMLALGCTSAINLDGGGSTTLWAAGFRGGDGGGIANFPCDDKRFDPAGERAVADVVLVHARAVVQLDDVDAIVTAGALQRSGDGEGQLGDGFLWAPAGESVRVVFAAAAPRTGRYEVQRRTVVAAGIDGPEVGFGGIGDHGGFSMADGGYRSDRGEAWVRVGTLNAKAGTILRVEAYSVGPPFVLDAIRFVELPK